MKTKNEISEMQAYQVSQQEKLEDFMQKVNMYSKEMHWQ